MKLLKLPFKIIALPFILVLSILTPLIRFLFCYAKVILHIISGIGVLLSIALFFAGTTQGCIVFLILSFLISPLGLPAIAEKLVGGLSSLNHSLQQFVMS